jgi:hypothetical protein
MGNWDNGFNKGITPYLSWNNAFGLKKRSIINSNIIISASSNILDLGDQIQWTDGAYFDSWTQTTTTSSHGGGGIRPFWQLYYAHKNISLKVVTSGIKLGTYGAGTNNWNWGIAIATSDNSTASFGTITEFATRSSTTYVSNAEYESNINQQIDIPAGRYFIIGNTYGPVYAAGKNYQYNRSAIINGEPYFTAINKCWSGGGNVTWEIPTQLGGTGSYSQSQPRVPVRSVKFSIT